MSGIKNIAKFTVTRHRAILAVMVAATSVLLADSSTQLRQTQISHAKGLTIIVRSSQEYSAPAQISIRSGRKDHKRRGFFKIGLLPIFVLEDVKIEVGHWSPSVLENVFEEIEKLTTNDPTSGIELRNMVFDLHGDVRALIKSGRGLLSRKGEEASLELLDSVSLEIDGAKRTASRASLCISGKSAGTFRLSSQPPETFNLNSVLLTPKVQP